MNQLLDGAAAVGGGEAGGGGGGETGAVTIWSIGVVCRTRVPLTVVVWVWRSRSPARHAALS